MTYTLEFSTVWTGISVLLAFGIFFGWLGTWAWYECRYHRAITQQRWFSKSLRRGT
jgi:hypothetical protein